MKFEDVKTFSQLPAETQAEIISLNSRAIETSELESGLKRLVHSAAIMLNIAPLDSLFALIDAMSQGLPGRVEIDTGNGKRVIFGDEGSKVALIKDDYKKALKYFTTLIQVGVIQRVENQDE